MSSDRESSEGDTIPPEPTTTSGQVREATSDVAGPSSEAPLPVIHISEAEVEFAGAATKVQTMSDRDASTLKRRADDLTDNLKAEYGALKGQSGSETPSTPGSEPPEAEMEVAYREVMSKVVPEATRAQVDAVALKLSQAPGLKRPKITEVTKEEEETDKATVEEEDRGNSGTDVDHGSSSGTQS